MQQSKVFPLKSQEKRKSGKFIIISHISNFSTRLDPMSPDMRGFVPYYCLHHHKRYFFEVQEKRTMPFHFLANFIMKDWEVLVTAPLVAKSELIQKAIDCGYIDQMYRDAIVIAVQDDYSTRIPDIRTWEVLGANVLFPLSQQLRLGNFRDTIFFFDEIFDFEKYNKDVDESAVNRKYPFSVNKTRYFDRVQFNLEARRFY